MSESLTISEMHRLIAAALKNEIGTRWVVGEILSIRKSGAHLYLELVERRGPARQVVSLLNMVVLAPQLKQVQHQLHKNPGVTLEVGVPIRVRGAMDVYGPRGSISFKVDDIDPSWTLGQLVADKDAVLRKISAEGLLEKQKRHALTLAPLKVGLVTSSGSAAEADFLDELRKSGIAFQVLISDTVVQGPDAPKQIEEALVKISRVRNWAPDVVAVVRGGGSKNDLAAYDTEKVARAIANAPWVVITGIGHEVDRSVSDEVAFSSFKTPTAAAHALVQRVRETQEKLEFHLRKTLRSTENALEYRLGRINTASMRVDRSAAVNVSNRENRLNAQEARFKRSAAVAVKQPDRHLTNQEERFQQACKRALNSVENFLKNAEALVKASSLETALQRGFSVTRADGKLVRSPADAPPGTVITTEIVNAQIESTVK